MRAYEEEIKNKILGHLQRHEYNANETTISADAGCLWETH